MPALGLLLQGLMGNMYALMLALSSAKQLVRFTAMGILAAAYVACALAFTLFIDPLLGALFSTAFGMLLGLAFPPIAGTVIAGVVGLWGCVVAKRYYVKFINIGLPH